MPLPGLHELLLQGVLLGGLLLGPPVVLVILIWGRSSETLRRVLRRCSPVVPLLGFGLLTCSTLSLLLIGLRPNLAAYWLCCSASMAGLYCCWIRSREGKGRPQSQALLDGAVGWCCLGAISYAYFRGVLQVLGHPANSLLLVGWALAVTSMVLVMSQNTAEASAAQDPVVSGKSAEVIEAQDRAPDQCEKDPGSPR